MLKAATTLSECAYNSGVLMARAGVPTLDSAEEMAEYHKESRQEREAFRQGFMSVHREEFLGDW